jgi:hypothetical protein
MANNTFHNKDGTDRINISDFSYPEIVNKYVGKASVFLLPIDMPSFVAFKSCFLPNPGMALQFRMENKGGRVFVNICYHDDTPKYPIGGNKPLCIGKEKASDDLEKLNDKVFDVVFHSSQWSILKSSSAAIQEKVFVRVLYAVQSAAGVKLLRAYKTPSVTNNYKGSEVTVLEWFGPDVELPPTALLCSGRFPTTTPMEFPYVAPKQRLFTLAPTGAGSVFEGKLEDVFGEELIVDGPFEPVPAYIVKSKMTTEADVFLNICSHSAVSDEVSCQRIIGCPYMICREVSCVDNLEFANALVYEIIVNPKYIDMSLNPQARGVKEKVMYFYSYLIY